MCLAAGAVQETELRTLKAAAEEVAGRFDAAVAALAAKRLDVLAEVRRLSEAGWRPCRGPVQAFKAVCMRLQSSLHVGEAAAGAQCRD